MNIIDNITEKLRLPHLQKIDPNTQEVKHPEHESADEFFYQAAIAAVLTAIYKYTRIKDGNTALLFGDTSGDLLGLIFGEDKAFAINKVAEYTGVTIDYAATRMEAIAKVANDVLKEQFPKDVTDGKVRAFFTDQRDNILKYIPAGLKLGDVFHDDSLDDRTHKMEGPISNHLHWIEKFFSGVDRKKVENW
jgi:hypothetical protein